MAKIEWDALDTRYSYGVERAVLYHETYGLAEAWNGLQAVEVSRSEGVDGNLYFEGHRRDFFQTSGEVSCVLRAFTYPETFHFTLAEQTKHEFGLSYVVTNNNVDELHLLYSVNIKRSESTFATSDSSPTPVSFGWTAMAKPVPVPGANPSAHLVLEYDEGSIAFREVLDILHGTDTTPARLPMPSEIVEIYNRAATFRITYISPGVYKAEGDSNSVVDLGGGAFMLRAPTVFVNQQSGRFAANSH